MAEVSCSGLIEMDECIPETYVLPIISKIQIARVIVKICGNEGTEDSEAKANMRRLLQSTIEYLEKETEAVWANAEVTVFDDYGNTIIMVSGPGKYKFTVSQDGMDETEVVNTERPGVFWRLKSYFACEEWQPQQAISHPDVEDTVHPTSGLIPCW